MRDVVDITLLSGQVLAVERELRLMRLQMDNLSSRLASLDSRTSGLEQSFHELVGEVSRGFGQMEQQMTRHEKRFDAVDVGLTALQGNLSDSTAQILQELKTRP
jgi:hypothetical protein